MIPLLSKKRLPTTVLGLALNGSRLEGVVVRRSNGSLQVQKTFSTALALNPLTADPQLVGREIRNHLEQADIRERRCAVALPVSWALVLQTEVPELPEEDIAGFLQIEAERGFHYAFDALSIATSRCRSTGKQFATQVAIPRNHLSQLEKVLKAAQLRPIRFTLGIAALQTPGKEDSDGVVALGIGESNVDLQVTCGGGTLVLRTLDSVFEAEGVQQRLSPELLMRELKITLGQLPAEFRESVRRIRVFGFAETARRFVNEAAPRAAQMGLSVEFVENYPPHAFSKTVPAGIEVSPAFSVVAQCVTGADSVFNFLPPKVRPWQQVTTRFSSRKLVWAGATAGAVLLLVGGAFAIQQWQLSRLRTRWARMEPKVRELDEMQQQIKRFRPWFDESVRSLTILRKLTEAFPEDGVVSAKTVEIRELSSVTCSGAARDNQALLKMLDQLRATKEVSNLKVDQIRGKTPLQFTFNFHWGEGGGDAN
jgi:hypothetical protein